jgi:hypothetical protein
MQVNVSVKTVNFLSQTFKFMLCSNSIISCYEMCLVVQCHWIRQIILLFPWPLESFRSRSCDKSIVFSKANSPQSAFCFKFQYPLFSSSSCLRLVPRIPVSYIRPSIFPSVAGFRWQFLRNIWPIHLGFFLFIVCQIFLSFLILRNTSSFLKCSVQMIFYILHQHHI